MEKKIIIIFIIILVIFGVVYLYKTITKPSRLEIRSSCRLEALTEAQEKFERENPEEKERIERGTYLKEDYDKYLNQCLVEEKY